MPARFIWFSKEKILKSLTKTKKELRQSPNVFIPLYGCMLFFMEIQHRLYFQNNVEVWYNST
jgi:hypothetical protein